MRLGIDLDGVVTDFDAGWMQVHADEFGSAGTSFNRARGIIAEQVPDVGEQVGAL
ncbi:hypothetical protein [Ilumatobacter sp.]|uniref:hypothetical protein n=1 Tax=Ilumatobacter sp. TaxID=1967498 RepID=UPI003AF674D0